MKTVPVLRLLALTLFCQGSLCAYAASPGPLFIPPADQWPSFQNGRLHVRIGIQSPLDGPIVGDVLYFHGFADRLDNHGPLFDSWNRVGLRVIGFDLPSHGGTTGSDNDISHYSFEDLAHVAALVESKTREDSSRPLILAGWSTGGLIVTRILQESWLTGYENRTPIAAILFAPGISVRLAVGKFGVVTQGTLTRNPAPPHHGAISPLSPALYPVFAVRLLANAAASSVDPLPSDIPILTLLGDDNDDHYVKTSDVRDWVYNQRSINHAEITGVQCPGGYHELDNEPAGVGHETRVSAALFALAYATGSSSVYSAPSGACTAF